MTAEIRAAFRDAWDTRELDDAMLRASLSADDLFDLDEFRESEVEALDAALSGARDALWADYDALMARYRDATEEAVVRFVSEHPEAPRAKPPRNVIGILDGAQRLADRQLSPA